MKRPPQWSQDVMVYGRRYQAEKRLSRARGRIVAEFAKLHDLSKGWAGHVLRRWALDDQWDAAVADGLIAPSAQAEA